MREGVLAGGCASWYSQLCVRRIPAVRDGQIGDYPRELDDLDAKAAIMGHARAATGTRPRHVRVLSSEHTQPNDGERRDIQHDVFDENIAANGRGGLYGRGVVSI